MSTAHEFIYILRPARADMLRTAPTTREAEIVARHFSYLQGLCSQGVVVLAGRTTTNDEHTLGVCIFRVGTPDEAQNVVSHDPAVAEGVMTATLSPFRIALLAPRTE